MLSAKRTAWTAKIILAIMKPEEEENEREEKLCRARTQSMHWLQKIWTQWGGTLLGITPGTKTPHSKEPLKPLKFHKVQMTKQNCFQGILD